MPSRWTIPVSLSLIAFACAAILWQAVHYNSKAESSIIMAANRIQLLRGLPTIAERDGTGVPIMGRQLDQMLPDNVRIFMPGLVGTTNLNKIGHFFFVTYFTFPREVAASLDQPAVMTKDGFLGTTTDSNEEMSKHGFDVRVDVTPGDILKANALHDITMHEPLNPDWMFSDFDLAIAFLLPLFTALSGMALLRMLSGAHGVTRPTPGNTQRLPSKAGHQTPCTPFEEHFSSYEKTPLLEQLACGLGLGMMAVAAVTLGVKLLGFHGHYLVFCLTAIGSLWELQRHREVFIDVPFRWLLKITGDPIALVIVAAGTLVFLILFRLAGLQGIIEFDAVMAWMLKAKMIHLFTGSELVKWFSMPRLTHAHLDYPTLVPSLHAATFDSIGHVNEFVTKFWSAWIVLLLIGAVASHCRGSSVERREPKTGGARLLRYAAPIGLLGFLLLPDTMKYVQTEGATIPMVFFVVIGCLQIAQALAKNDSSRLYLGLTLMLGAGMCKFEGFIFLAVTVFWAIVIPSARRVWEFSIKQLWRAVVFCLLAALPYLCLRARITPLHYESGWAGYAFQHPGAALLALPWTSLTLFLRWFLDPQFANWSVEGGHFHWDGRWNGLSSLYNHSTLGLSWLCLFLTIALWFTAPARRRVIIWLTATLASGTFALAVIFAIFANITNFAQITGSSSDVSGERYLLPLLVAWFTTILTLLFAEPSASGNAQPQKMSKKEKAHLA